MPYYTGKLVEKSRGKAMKMLVIEKKPVQLVANHFGVDRTTIWRWYKKWKSQNSHIELENQSRRKYLGVSPYKYRLCKWDIPSVSAAPHHPHTLSDDLVQLVLDVRDQLKRCAEVVWYYINSVLCIKISLSSVCRILKKHHKLKKTKSHKNQQYKGIERPKALIPGILVETDTIHLYNPVSKTKRYVYTVIDVYTRMTYARVYDEIRPGLAIKTILEAEQYFGFKFYLVQSDNGPEFSKYFAERLKGQDIQIRHTRLGRPNDNAHIERFNRTIQEECTGSYTLNSVSLQCLNLKIQKYLDFYNYHRVHLGIEYRTPAEMLQRF